jgi:hypothetical protein
MKFCMIIVLFLTLAATVNASVHINELYPVPATGQNEWVELYNDSSSLYDLTNHVLKDIANNTIPLPASIPANSYISIDISNILNNTGDTILFLNGSTTLEIATYSGTFTSAKSAARCPDGTGQWNIVDTQTRNATNTPACPIPTQQPNATSTPTPTPLILAVTSTPTPTNTPTPTPTSAPITGVMISEAMVQPLTGEYEWVELYNDNDLPVFLDDWYVDDTASGGASPKVFTAIIPEKGYAVVDLTSSLFNNDSDFVRLLNTEKEEVDVFQYEYSEKGKTIGRNTDKNNEICIQEPSKGFTNNSCNVEEDKAVPATTVTPIQLIKTSPQHSVTPSPQNNVSSKISDLRSQIKQDQSTVLAAHTDNKKTSTKQAEVPPSQPTQIPTAFPLSALSLSFFTVISLAVKIYSIVIV